MDLLTFKQPSKVTAKAVNPMAEILSTTDKVQKTNSMSKACEGMLRDVTHERFIDALLGVNGFVDFKPNIRMFAGSREMFERGIKDGSIAASGLPVSQISASLADKSKDSFVFITADFAIEKHVQGYEVVREKIPVSEIKIREREGVTVSMYVNRGFGSLVRKIAQALGAIAPKKTSSKLTATQKLQGDNAQLLAYVRRLEDEKAQLESDYDALENTVTTPAQPQA
jgi:hypothetical protein